METCANCERKIGRLEPAHLHNDSVVCGECIERLADTPKVQTIEQTAKRWKVFQLLGAVVFFVAFPVLPIAGYLSYEVAESWSVLGYIASPFVIAGLALYLYSKFGAWWHHG